MITPITMNNITTQYNSYKHLLTAIVVLAISLVATAQPQQEQCSSAIIHQRLMATNPAYAQRMQLNEQLLQQAIAARGPINTVQTVPYIIPVVVHVIHLGEPVGTGTNISDAQILSAIQSLNYAYRKAPGTHFDGSGVDANIEFCLVQKDTAGNPTTGINRIDGTGIANYENVGITDTNEAQIKALNFWDNTKYYNIWVVSEIDDNNGGAGTQGYAYYPPGGYFSLDGTVVLHNAFGFDPNGTIGYNLKPYTNLNTTMVHEIGHALDLFHSFQGDSSGTACPPNTLGQCATEGDMVCDIPPHKRSTSNCIADTTSNLCAPGTTAGDYQHNYMDYSSQLCRNMFSADQSTRMSGTLTSLRASLVSQSNLLACGCGGASVTIAQTSGSDTVCAGQSVSFTATPEGATANIAFQWYLNGDSIAGATTPTLTSSTLVSGELVCIIIPDTLNPSDTDTSNTISITVLPVVTPSVSIVNQSGLYNTCTGNTVTFVATPTAGGNAPIYQWHVNGTTIGTDTSKLVTTLPFGTDIITCTIVSSEMCATPTTANSNSITVTVANGPVINYVTDQNVCGGTVAATNLSSSPAGATYQWTNSNPSIGLGAFGSGPNIPSFTAVNGTTAPIQATITVKPQLGLACLGTQASYVITVNPTPMILQNGASLTTFNTGPSYQWFRNNLPIPGANDPTYTPVEPGNYSLIISNSPCSSNVIITTTDIEEKNNPYYFELYPNPNNGVCTILFNALVTTEYKLEIKNALGALVYKETLGDFAGAYSKQLNLAEYGKGIYFISISNSINETVKKIVVY